MKKSQLVFVLLSSILLISMFASVSATSQVVETLSSAVTSIGEVLNPVLQWTLGDVSSSPGVNSADLFVVKVLLFILMLSILYLAVKEVPFLKENNFVVWTVSIVTAILGARMLSTQSLVELVWLPSGVLSVSLVALLPFVVFFFFIESFEGMKTIRRFGWALFAVLYVVLALLRWDDLAATTFKGFNLGWVYIIAAALALLSMLLDRTIQGLFLTWQHEHASAPATKAYITEQKRIIAEANEDFSKDIITQAERNDIIKRARAKMKTFG